MTARRRQPGSTSLHRGRDVRRSVPSSGLTKTGTPASVTPSPTLFSKPMFEPVACLALDSASATSGARMNTVSSAPSARGTSGVGRKQLLMQATPRLRLGLSVRLVPGRPNMPELQGYPLHPFRLQEGHVVARQQGRQEFGQQPKQPQRRRRLRLLDSMPFTGRRSGL